MLQAALQQTFSTQKPLAQLVTPGVQGWPGQANAQAVSEREDSVRNLGISAVPTFIFERTLGVSGAHPPEALANAIREAVK